MNARGKVAVITGGAVRLGRAMAQALADDGLRIVVHYGTSAAEARELTNEIEQNGGEAVAVQADLRSPVDAAETVISAACQAFGQVDMLINNASIFEPGTLAELTEDQWDRHLSINLKAATFFAKEFAAALPPEQEGHLLNIADWRALRPGTGYLAYTVSKAGLIALTQSLARELAPAVQVNGIALGAILAPEGQEAAHRERAARTIPLQRTGSVEEVVRAVRFLLGSDFVTGEILHLTGGEHL